MTFTSAAGANGSATVSVKIHDNGGTANGGHDTSPPVTFTISIGGVNDPPTFNVGADQDVLEDSGVHTVSGWASGISPGPPDESGQTITFSVTNDNNALFSSQPAVSGSTGNLAFTPAPNANGTATVTIFATDSGGILNGGDNTSDPQTFSISVTPVNDAPSFAKESDQTLLEDSPAATITGWATALSKGPPDEVGQTLTFVITANNKPTMFSVPPAISATGDLTFTLAPNANGNATIGVELRDNGTTANGGHDTSAVQTFHIIATPVNDAPVCTNATGATFVGAQLNGTLTTCTDIDGDTLHYAIVAGPAHGTASITTANQFTYTPATTFQGNDSFTFQATDFGICPSEFRSRDDEHPRVAGPDREERCRAD